MDERRQINVVESSSIPRLDILFGFAPMAPFIVGVTASWWFSGSKSLIVLQGTTPWGCSILLFLSGVRRGLSFRTESGPTRSQLGNMLTLYGLGLGALAALWLNMLIAALALLLIGYLIILIGDPIAARRGEVPLHFALLRRIQIPLALLSLAAALVRVVLL